MDGPVIPSASKADAEMQEKRKYNVLFLDTDLQKHDKFCRRLKEGVKIFCKDYVRDWVTCPLMLLYIGSLIFAIISALISYNPNQVQLNRTY